MASWQMLQYYVNKFLQVDEFELVAELVCDEMVIPHDALPWDVHAEASFAIRFPPRLSPKHTANNKK